METLQRRCTEDEQIIKERKYNVEDELKDVQPDIDKAREAVGSLKPDNLREIKSYTMPPDAVSDVLQGVLLLMGE